MSEGSTVDINEFHKLFNHSAEETLKLTAKSMKITLTGILKPCYSCTTANARQKNVTKRTKTLATKIGEITHYDVTSVRDVSFGGNQCWGMAVDAYTNQSDSHFVKTKDAVEKPVMGYLRKMHKEGTPVEILRMDYGGENQLIEQAIALDPLVTTKIQYTPRDSPQYNGIVERKFAWLWHGVRAVLNHAKLPQSIRGKLWPEAARYVELVSNNIITPRKKDLGSPYQRFHGKEWESLRYLKPFGTMGIVKTGKSIQSKLTDKGTPMIHLGPGTMHATDVYRMFNPNTKGIVTTRDITWMNQMYGDWKGLANPPELEAIARVPSDPIGDAKEGLDEPEGSAKPKPMAKTEPPVKDNPQTETKPEPTHTTPPTAEQQGTQLNFGMKPPTAKVVNQMRQLETSYNPIAKDFMQRNRDLQSLADPPRGSSYGSTSTRGE
jgi:hypothetical protein